MRAMLTSTSRQTCLNARSSSNDVRWNAPVIARTGDRKKGREAVFLLELFSIFVATAVVVVRADGSVEISSAVLL
jgi:hypothetical protein